MCLGASSWIGPEILYGGPSKDGDTQYDVWDIFQIASVLNAYECMKINFINNMIESGKGYEKEIQDAFDHMVICAYDV